MEYRRPRTVRELLIYESENGYYRCPRCGVTLEREFCSYCDRCGQCLDWSGIDRVKIITEHKNEKYP